MHSNDRLLLVGDGLVAPEAAIARLVALDGPAILVVPDLRVDDRYERIDAQSRWAGLALIDGEMLKQTAADAARLGPAVDPAAPRRPGRGAAAQRPRRGRGRAAAGRGDARRISPSSRRRSSPAPMSAAATGSRATCSAPVERLATRLLMPTAVTPTALGLAADPADAARRPRLRQALARPRPRLPAAGDSARRHRRAPRLASAAGRARGRAGGALCCRRCPAGVLLVLASTLAATRGWGCVALAGTIIAFAAGACASRRRGARCRAGSGSPSARA